MNSENLSKSKMLIGIQPTGWTNDDFPEIGDSTPYQTILDQTAASGFQGGSTGHNYPTHFPSLQVALETRNLGITSTWVSTHFTIEGQFETTIKEVEQQIDFLKAIGAKDIVVAEFGNCVQLSRTKRVLKDRPRFNEPEWYLLSTGLNYIGQLAHNAGLRLSFHPHVGTGVETAEDTDLLMSITDPKYVNLCVDTGHLYFAGSDPVKVTLQHIDRIGHVHLKSVREEVRKVAQNYSFFQAIQSGIFTVPGDPEGAVDTDAVIDLLVENGYSGWLAIEAEQDPSNADPLKMAQTARRYLKQKLGY